MTITELILLLALVVDIISLLFVNNKEEKTIAITLNKFGSSPYYSGTNRFIVPFYHVKN